MGFQFWFSVVSRCGRVGSSPPTHPTPRCASCSHCAAPQIDAPPCSPRGPTTCVELKCPRCLRGGYLCNRFFCVFLCVFCFVPCFCFSPQLGGCSPSFWWQQWWLQLQRRRSRHRTRGRGDRPHPLPLSRQAGRVFDCRRQLWGLPRAAPGCS